MAVAPERTRAVARDWLPDMAEVASMEHTDAPRSVSVIITTCGNPPTLERCLRSVLHSDYDDFEVIVVDHGPPSPDTARMLVMQFPGELRLRYLEEPWSSASMARNTGLARAEAAIVAFIDDDAVVDAQWMRYTAWRPFVGEADVGMRDGSKRVTSAPRRDATRSGAGR